MDKKVKRNDPCPCGSGRKYKQCCMQKEQAGVKTYTNDGKRKFKAKVLSSSSTVSQFFSSKASYEKETEQEDPLKKMRFEKTKEDFQVDDPVKEMERPTQEESISRFKKMPSHQPGSPFKPTNEDFQQNSN